MELREIDKTEYHTHKFSLVDRIKVDTYSKLNDKIKNEVKDLCIKYVPHWNNYKREDINIELITSCITNVVYKASFVGAHTNSFVADKVFIKKKTPHCSVIYDSDLQYQVAKILGNNNCGPRVLAYTGEYSIQEWIEGKGITNRSFQNISLIAGLASSLAKFHKKCTEIAPKEWDRTPFCLSRPEKWLPYLKELIPKYNLELDYSEVVNCFDIYKRVIENHVKSSNSVANSIMFCHNDLFYKNILDSQHGIFLVDFDFSGFNYVGWEIAFLYNMINIVVDPVKPPHFSVDNSLLTEEMKVLFASIYLSEFFEKNVLPWDQRVRDFLTSVEMHLLGAHLYHITWSIVMMAKPHREIVQPFDYHGHMKFKYSQFMSQLKKLTTNHEIKY